MSIREILASKGTAGVQSIAPDSPVMEAIGIMTKLNIGSLVVKQDDKMVGLLQYPSMPESREYSWKHSFD